MLLAGALALSGCDRGSSAETTNAAWNQSGKDPLVGKHLGGVIVFGGGLPLYGDKGVIGALGVSGDSSCADHNVAWRVRHALGLDHVPGGVTPDKNDGIIYDIQPDKTSASGYGHPKCRGKEAEIATQIKAGYVPPWGQAGSAIAAFARPTNPVSAGKTSSLRAFRAESALRSRQMS